MQEFCPVHRVEFVPGPRNDEQLAAPEVKFVRKKFKKKTVSPLSVITDLLAPHSNETGTGTGGGRGEERMWRWERRVLFLFVLKRGGAVNWQCRTGGEGGWRCSAHEAEARAGGRKEGGEARE